MNSLQFLLSSQLTNRDAAVAKDTSDANNGLWVPSQFLSDEMREAIMKGDTHNPLQYSRVEVHRV
jgi:hypothetical protein